MPATAQTARRFSFLMGLRDPVVLILLLAAVFDGISDNWVHALFLGGVGIALAGDVYRRRRTNEIDGRPHLSRRARGGGRRLRARGSGGSDHLRPRWRRRDGGTRRCGLHPVPSRALSGPSSTPRPGSRTRSWSADSLATRGPPPWPWQAWGRRSSPGDGPNRRPAPMPLPHPGAEGSSPGRPCSWPERSGNSPLFSCSPI